MNNTLLLKEKFVEEQFEFSIDANRMESPAVSRSLEKEYQAVREGIAAADLSDVLIYEIIGDEAADYLDFVLTGSVFRLREEHLLHTLCVDDAGEILSDVYVLNIDSEKYYLLADGGDYEALDGFLRKNIEGFDITLKDVRDEYALFSIDGPHCTFCVKEVFGPEVLGLRYMAFLPVEENSGDVYVCRAGKTGEYGYWIMSPRKNGVSIFEKIWSAAGQTDYPMALYGRRLDKLLRLENNFFNYETVKNLTRNPFEIGMFWAVDLDKDMAAKDAVDKIIESTVGRKVIGFRADRGALSQGDSIYYKGTQIGQVIDIQPSPSQDGWIGQGLLDADYVYTGLSYEAGEDPVEIITVNMPFILNKSLSVKVS
nr:glycine cleavage T C-terminal barrel domain-containing protein [uncultured Desulfobacter sp.]